LALHRDLQRVIVPVPVRVVALSEDAPVFFRGEFGTVVVMRGGKLGFAGEIDHKSFCELDVWRRECTRTSRFDDSTYWTISVRIRVQGSIPWEAPRGTHQWLATSKNSPFPARDRMSCSARTRSLCKRTACGAEHRMPVRRQYLSSCRSRTRAAAIRAP